MNSKKPLNLKPEFVERMKELLSPADFGRYKKILQEPILRSIRVNTLKISPEELKSRLESKGWKIKQPWPKHKEVMIVEGKFVSDKFSEEENNIDNKNIGVNNKIISDDESISKKYKIKSKLMDKNNKSLLKGVSELTIKDKLISERSEPNKEGVGENKVLVDLSPGELGKSLEHQLGYYYIQELASMLPALVLEPKPGEFVLDLAASPGSKTTQISALMQNKGTIIANEISYSRLKILAGNLERCGCSNTIITKKEGVALCKRLKNKNVMFDRILIDAPCSGEGTLRSTPKTALMWNPQTIISLSKLQKRLVESALEVLKPNVVLVYSTCTHAPEENEGVISYILDKFKDKIKIESLSLPIKCNQGITSWEKDKYDREVTKSCRIYPHVANTEGFFIAKLKKIR